MRHWTVLTSSPRETGDLGSLLGTLAPSSTVLLLYGDLGSGKTCLTQGLARGLGVPEEEPVTSPTYTLMNQHAGRLPLYHFDLYRLSGAEDLLDLGFEEYLQGEGVTVVEWAERAGDLPVDALCIEFSPAEDDTRRITFRPRGGQYEGLLSRLQGAWQQRGKR